jgi:hypothetical protein
VTTRLMLALVGIVIAPCVLSGQERGREQRAALDAVRLRSNTAAAVGLLRGERHALSPNEMKALVDSLVEISSKYRRGDPIEDDRAANAARVTVFLAASAEGGTAYAGAFQALVRMLEGTADPGGRLSVLSLIAQLPNQERAVTFVVGLAVGSDQSLARKAVELLGNEMGIVGLRRLEALYRADAIEAGLAKNLVEAIAAHHGWERNRL